MPEAEVRVAWCSWQDCPNRAAYVFNDSGLEFRGRKPMSFTIFYLCKAHAKRIYVKLNEHVRSWVDEFSIDYEFDGVPKGRIVNDER